MIKSALILSALLIAAPALAQFAPVPNLLEQQRREIESGRYGITPQQDHAYQAQRNNPYTPQPGINPRADQVYQPMQPGVLPNPVQVQPRRF